MSYAPLWLALRLTDLPGRVLGAATGEAADEAMVWVHKHRVTHVNAGAQALGVKPGMDVTTATALGAGHSQARDFAGETRAMDELANRLYAFTPYIQQRPHPVEPGLQLELSRCLKLFGGVEALVGKIAALVEHLDFACLYGLGHSAEAAWLLAQQPDVTQLLARVTSGGNHRQAQPEPLERKVFIQHLATVPLGRVSDFPEAVAGLGKSGFLTFGDLARQIERDGISSLKRRFGAEFAAYLAKVYDIDQHLHQASLFHVQAPVFQPASHFSEWLQFDYPIVAAEQIYPAMRLLLEQLATYLRTHQQQCQQIVWELADIHGNSESLTVASDRAQYSADLLFELSRIKLAHHPLAFEADSLGLVCAHTEALQNRDQALNFEGGVQHNPQAISITAAKLKAQLGEQAVFKVSHCDRHVPEKSVERIRLDQRAWQTIEPGQQHLLRPNWLLPNPQPVQERARGLYWQGYLTLVNGPERIQTEWWESPVARDYFIARRADDLHLWVYQDLHSKQWYVQGVFG